MKSETIRIRLATPSDLPQINRVIGLAIARWRLPERVKRLALPGYLYSEHDLDHLEIILAESVPDACALGIAALEPASRRELPPGRSGLLLHGLYVDPAHQRMGIGRRLLAGAMKRVASAGLDGLLVKAQEAAAPFFVDFGMTPLAVEDWQRDYPYRFWHEADQS